MPDNRINLLTGQLRGAAEVMNPAARRRAIEAAELAALGAPESALGAANAVGAGGSLPPEALEAPTGAAPTMTQAQFSGYDRAVSPEVKARRAAELARLLRAQ